MDESALLRTLIDHIPDCHIFVKDAKSRFVTTNAAHLKTLGAKSVKAVVGKTDFNLFPKDLAAHYYADEQSVIATGRPVLNREELVIDHDGNRKWYLTTKVPLRRADGRVTGVIGISRDITERKRLEEDLRRKNAELERLSITDSLTGAYNRRFLAEEFRIMLSAFSRTRKSLSVILFDIDDFKRINDRHGHDVGDEVLRTCCRAARTLMRRKDDLLIRFGGDEFVLVLFNTVTAGRPRKKGVKTAEHFANALLRTVQSTAFGRREGRRPVKATLSAGVAGMTDREPFEALLRRADAALYDAKAKGKNRVVVYDPARHRP